MIGMVTEWIKNIIYIVLFASFLELLLPNSSMQRFIRVIMGLLIMLAILNPVILVIGNPLSLEQSMVTIGGSSGLKAAEVLNSASKITQTREELTRNIYCAEMAKQIKALVMTVEGVTDAGVKVELQEHRPDAKMSLINKVTIYVDTGFQRPQKIAKISIINTQENLANELRADIIDKIKRVLMEFYGLNNRQIEVRKMN